MHTLHTEAVARRVTHTHVRIVPHDRTKPLINIHPDTFVGSGDAIWLAVKRAEGLCLVDLSEADLDSPVEEILALYRGAPAVRIPLGEGVWSPSPASDSPLWRRAGERGHSKLDIVLAFLDVPRGNLSLAEEIVEVVTVGKETQVSFGYLVSNDPTLEIVRNPTSRKAMRLRVTEAAWLVSSRMRHGQLSLKIAATKAADYDEIASAIIDRYINNPAPVYKAFADLLEK